MRTAEEDGENEAALHFSQARDVDEYHAKLYMRALDHLIWDRKTEYFLCSVCGYISDGRTPENFPICGALKSNFVKIDI